LEAEDMKKKFHTIAYTCRKPSQLSHSDKPGKSKELATIMRAGAIDGAA
jgi:hypothetical protein